MALIDQLSANFPQINFQTNLPMSSLTYFKLGGPAEVYVEIDRLPDLTALVSFCNQEKITLTLIGGGSNVIVADEGVPGLVIKLTHQDISQTDDPGIIRAGAGVKTALLVRQTVDWGYRGLEYFLGVPGTIGGAIYNNSHYLEDLIGEHVHRVQIVTAQGKVKWLTQAECDFEYDHSRFHQTQEIIWEVEFKLSSGDKDKSWEKIKEATLYRAQTQPLGLPSSGCIFKNSPNTPELKKQFPQFKDRQFIPSGFLIDQAGLKNTRLGDIEVSDKHAAFFINHGQGTAKQLKALIELVKAKTKEKFNVTLEEEVFYLPKKELS